MYSEATVRILSSLNIYLQEVTGFTPAINLITRFIILSNHEGNSPHEPPPPPRIIYQTEVSGILQSKCFRSSMDLDFLKRLS
jgi:hypothetical protein